MMRLAVLGSTRGTNLSSLIDAIDNGHLQATIDVVVSNKEQALILERAKSHDIPAVYCPVNGLGRSAYDEAVSAILMQYSVDLVVLIGYMRILSKEFVSMWANKVINVHPSLLPAFAGKIDLEVHKEVLESGVKETGCTVHYVTEMLDAGPIILQKKCSVESDDTIESLKAKVQQLEGSALVDSIQLIAKRTDLTSL